MRPAMLVSVGAVSEVEGAWRMTKVKVNISSSSPESFKRSPGESAALSGSYKMKHLCQRRLEWKLAW